ncbi:hypothetical protein J1N10_11955 [Carboxylicivirga sp. A043]|uniref:hypothetical protein n=1 Tax=Carboxylicivirga litoralis TaxID=2816963 RepID=UPI0021CB45C8|nr:hypothetical protein [Carboxylicivirga sp. A043]MCU4156693.1 hypothetical protein [Carboxylicivirga sp. A043]
MLKHRKKTEYNYVDNAKQRVMIGAMLEKLKDIALFIVVAIVLSWLVLGVM